jgi:hypothetical protein
MINYPVENNKNRRLIFLCNKKISSSHFQMLQTSYSCFLKYIPSISKLKVISTFLESQSISSLVINSSLPNVLDYAQMANRRCHVVLCSVRATYFLACECAGAPRWSMAMNKVSRAMNREQWRVGEKAWNEWPRRRTDHVRLTLGTWVASVHRWLRRCYHSEVWGWTKSRRGVMGTW